MVLEQRAKSQNNSNVTNEREMKGGGGNVDGYMTLQQLETFLKYYRPVFAVRNFKAVISAVLARVTDC